MFGRDCSKEILQSYDGSKMKRLEELSWRSGCNLHGFFFLTHTGNVFSFLFVITSPICITHIISIIHKEFIHTKYQQITKTEIKHSYFPKVSQKSQK